MREPSTFGYVVASKLAVLAGFMREGKLKQIEYSQHLINGSVHVWQPAGQEKLSEGTKDKMLTVHQ